MSSASSASAAGRVKSNRVGRLDGQLLFAVYKQAPGNDWQGEEDAEDFEDPQVDDPAYRKLCEKTRDLMKENPQLTFAQAFSICYTANSSLADLSKRHHAEKVAKAWMPASEGSSRCPR